MWPPPQQGSTDLCLHPTDEELYAGVYIDFMGTDAAIFRTMGKQTAMRTDQYNSRWLNGEQQSGERSRAGKEKHWASAQGPQPISDGRIKHDTCIFFWPPNTQGSCEGLSGTQSTPNRVLKTVT